MKNEKKDLFYIAIIIILFTLFVAGTVTAGFYKIRYDKYLQQSRLVTEQLTDATNRLSDAEERLIAVRTTVRGAIERATRAENLCSESIITVEEIRKEVKDLEDNYCRLYDYVLSINNILDCEPKIEGEQAE